MSTSSNKNKMPAAFLPVLSAGLVAAVAYALWPEATPPPPPPQQPPPVQQQPTISLPPASAPFADWVNAANHLMDQGAFPAAIEGYTEAINRDSNVVEIWVDRGACRHALGDLEGAEYDFRHAMTINAEHVTAHFNLGIVFYSAGNTDSARTYWEWVLDKAPSSNEGSRARTLLAQLEQGPG